MKNIVLYYSKSGNTKKYAEIIGRHPNFKVYDIRKVSKKQIAQADFVIYGSGVYIYRLKKLSKVLKIVSPTKLALFACGGSDDANEMLGRVLENNFTEEESKKYAVFYLPGGLNVKQMKPVYQMMFKMMKKMLEKKETRTKDEQALLDSIATPSYFVDETHCDALYRYVEDKINL